MAKNQQLSSAKQAKNDEFYTQYETIEAEMSTYLDYSPKAFRNKVVLCPCDDPEWSNFSKYFAQNFERLGLKKLISTSYAPSRRAGHHGQPTLFETSSDKYDETLSNYQGRIFTLERDRTGDGRTDFHDIEWDYLDGDGDFRSSEVTALRDEADIIVTNPPFSLFREFLAWIREAKKPKQFSIVGNMNAITYTQVFPLLQNNELWLGASVQGTIEFEMPGNSTITSSAQRQDDDGRIFMKMGNVRWFTNIDHGRRHKPLSLMTKADNIKFSKHKEIRGIGYPKYDNYNAIEVSYTDAIPSDHKGVMGVPISFLDKYCPEQFEILGMCENHDLYGLKTKRYTSAECKEAYFSKFKKTGTYDLNASGVLDVDGQFEKVYQRILIRHRKDSK